MKGVRVFTELMRSRRGVFVPPTFGPPGYASRKAAALAALAAMSPEERAALEAAATAAPKGRDPAVLPHKSRTHGMSPFALFMRRVAGTAPEGVGNAERMREVGRRYAALSDEERRALQADAAVEPKNLRPRRILRAPGAPRRCIPVAALFRLQHKGEFGGSNTVEGGLAAYNARVNAAFAALSAAELAELRATARATPPAPKRQPQPKPTHGVPVFAYHLGRLKERHPELKLQVGAPAAVAAFAALSPAERAELAAAAKAAPRPPKRVKKARRTVGMPPFALFVKRYCSAHDPVKPGTYSAAIAAAFRALSPDAAAELRAAAKQEPLKKREQCAAGISPFALFVKRYRSARDLVGPGSNNDRTRPAIVAAFRALSADARAALNRDAAATPPQPKPAQPKPAQPKPAKAPRVDAAATPKQPKPLPTKQSGRGLGKMAKKKDKIDAAK
jgi:hypothetical protein